MATNNLEKHFITRSGWLRAAVLGANDGILSTASIAVGVAAATDIRDPIILASVAGLVAGALSMAAGEYVSVSSQTDIEEADIERERQELIDDPEFELEELARIYESRGLTKETAMEVARQLTEYDALEAHTRDELGITEVMQARPLQAALASGAAFIAGGVIPLLVSLIAPLKQMIAIQYVVALVALVLLGALAARTGGSSVPKAVVRISLWGTMAMGMTALVGYLFDVNVL